jgi:hypothetical protein
MSERPAQLEGRAFHSRRKPYRHPFHPQSDSTVDGFVSHLVRVRHAALIGAATHKFVQDILTLAMWGRRYYRKAVPLALRRVFV